MSTGSSEKCAHDMRSAPPTRDGEAWRQCSKCGYSEPVVRSSNERVSDERLAALVQYGAPGGLAPHDFAKIVRELLERRSHETCDDPQPVALVGYVNEMPDIIYPGTTRLEGRRYLPIWRYEDHPSARRDAAKAEHAQKADAVRAYPHNPPDGCLDCLKAERNLTQVSSI